VGGFFVSETLATGSVSPRGRRKTLYLYRESSAAPLVPHDPDVHSYACDYLGGDSGPEVKAEEYALFRLYRGAAIFQYRPSGKFCPAVQVGSLSHCPIGDDWRQAQAHLMVPRQSIRSKGFTAATGPFAFYNLVAILEACAVSSEEAAANGYFGDALYNLRGRVRSIFCATPQEARGFLDLISPAIQHSLAEQVEQLIRP
jgi:hypothetical protein